MRSILEEGVGCWAGRAWKILDGKKQRDSACHDLSAASFQNSYVEAVTPCVVVFGKGAIGR